MEDNEIMATDATLSEGIFMLKLISLFCLVMFLTLIVSPVMAGNNSGQAFTRWPDTGQTKCYNNTAEIPCPPAGAPFYGQDGRYAAPARSYTVIGGGTMVQDNVTGLIWEQKTNADYVQDYADPHDADNEYTWCDTDTNTNGGDEGVCGENDTMDFLAQLNNANFGGHNDWRLPTIKELATLVDLGRAGPPLIDPVFVIEPYINNWSATTEAASKDLAWNIDFTTGYDEHGVMSSYKGLSNGVRAVRGGSPVPPAYIDNGETVMDTVSGLEWQKAVKGPMNWEKALAYADGLVLGGKSDWRLPDKNELRSLLDYSTCYPAIDKVFAATTPPWGGNYWTSTSSSEADIWGGPAYAWPIGFGEGPWGIYGDKSTGYYVRVVRGGQSTVVPDPIIKPLPWLHLMLRHKN
jgi:hypothetical protein